MTQQTINVGAAPNDGTGDPARTSFQKVNSNFTELYATTTGITSATTGQVLYANGGVAAGAAGLTYTLATGNVSVAAPVSGAALTSYGTILFGAANPALVFNIGGAQIYSTLANTLQFSSDGTPTERMRIGAAGNVTINAPSSGTALKAVAVSGSAAISSTSGPYYVDNNSHPAFVINSNGTDYGMIAHVTGNLWCLGSGTVLNTTGVNTLQWNNTGNVTINAPSSGAALTVAGQVKVTPASGAAAIDGVYAGTATGSTLGSLRFYGSGGGVTGEVDVTGVLETGSLVNSACLFYTALSGSLTEKMRLDSSGNLGLGVTPKPWAAGSGFDVASWAGFGQQSTNGHTVVTGNAYYNGTNYKYKNTASATLYECSGPDSAHRWYCYASGSAGATLAGGAGQAMTLDASGNLLVGTTSTTPNPGVVTGPSGFISIGNNAGSNGFTFQYFVRSGASIGSITQSGTTAVLYNTTSDQRLKTNIVDAAPASSLIDAIKVRSFDWISDNSHQRYGMVAQELYEVVPEAVHSPEDPDAMMAVDYSKLVPLLVKEIQDLRARLAALEAK